MSGAASLLQGQASPTLAAGRLSRHVLERRVAQRRQILIVQAISYSLITTVLLVYCYAGTISMAVPSVYFLSGIALIGFFVVLSETHINDRLEDHYLTIFQIGGHVALQLCFLLAAPEIGFAFLSVLFLIFGFGALRMTSRQVIIAWTLTAMGLAPIFLLTSAPIGMPVATDIRTPCRTALLRPDHRTVCLRRTLRQFDAKDALQSQFRTQGSLQAHRGTRRARRTDRFVQPPQHHADAGRRDRPRPSQQHALLDRPDRSRLVQAHQRRATAIRPATRCSGPSPSRCSPTSAASTSSAATAARNSCWCCPT